MILSDISSIRLTNQQIITTEFKNVKDIVGWMGAMQAQDYAMAKWAIGARLPNSTIGMVEEAIDKAEVIRTHLLRPTWHIVSAEDIYWLLELTASKIKASLGTRHKGLELTESIIGKTNSLIQNALSGGKHLTREELVAIFEASKIATNDNRTSHIMLSAELDGIVCSGAAKGNKQTYALLNERVPKPKSIIKEESLERIALKYFTSRCPATLQDFVWWSGLSIGDARIALEMVKSNFVSEKIGSETYLFTNSFSLPKEDKNFTHLLPAFDEFLICYKDRSASLPPSIQKKAVSDNGIFWPIVVLNGQVIGLWKRTIKKDVVIIETKFFQSPNKSTISLIDSEVLKFGRFLGRKAVLG